jgi:hypothetical protein
LLQGEQLSYYVAPDSSRRVVCELCVPRAERVRWVREREGEEIVQLRPTRSERAGFMRRVGDFFGAHEAAEEDDFAGGAARPDQDKRRKTRASRRSSRDAAPEPPEIDVMPRDVAAVPTGPESRLQRGLELFNTSQFPRTIAGLSRSLGDPQVSAVNAVDGTAVDIWVGWDLAWYSYRVTLGDPTEPVEQSGRGNDIDELAHENLDWNAGADGFGRLFILNGSETSDLDDGENPAP